MDLAENKKEKPQIDRSHLLSSINPVVLSCMSRASKPLVEWLRYVEKRSRSLSEQKFPAWGASGDRHCAKARLDE
jgi:hypothetical protein